MPSSLTRYTTPATRPRPGTHPARRGTESALARTRRARRINRTLARAYPDAHCELTFRSPFELLVATVLSAQCTDVRVNQVTPALFRRFPGPAEMAQAPQVEVEELIRSTGFYRAKARNIIALSERIVGEHGGEVPRDLDSLVALPGVGRKTAHVVRGNAFGVPGLTVDTHFGRLSRRLGLSSEEDPLRIEKDIAQLIEKSEWTMFSHRMIFHGRRVCHSRRAACGACFLAADCPSFGEAGPTDPALAESLLTGDNVEHLARMAGLDPEEES
ncbi:endonuclease III [Corynebacterium uropygiale]|uniref:Endonuclease III n=2 Tax=Corynebacterium uropygiale TaxID=1775911 RepID=A0A9X1QQK1_9CORY|nr:endonuclease III [Corynebacterium uropygiale]MCF4005744.1 endonuclease III [Corynebacterium uropygiale]